MTFQPSFFTAGKIVLTSPDNIARELRAHALVPRRPERQLSCRAGAWYCKMYLIGRIIYIKPSRSLASKRAVLLAGRCIRKLNIDRRRCRSSLNIGINVKSLHLSTTTMTIEREPRVRKRLTLCGCPRAFHMSAWTTTCNIYSYRLDGEQLDCEQYQAYILTYWLDPSNDNPALNF